MTEAEKIICKMYLENYGKYKDCNEYKLLMGLLEQEPCEDAISRTKAIKTIQRYGVGALDFEDYTPEQAERFVINQLNELPSVLPQQKVGKWINKYAEDACGERYSYWACSECGRDVGFNLANIEDVLSEYPYCHCGAKMVEPQESEDKE